MWLCSEINISGGDLRDWPDGAVDFRGHFSEWPAYADRYLRQHEVTDILLFGDCRPYHVSALGIAELRNVRTHVLEEGYLRPDWMTLEREGVNAHSTLGRDRESILARSEIPATRTAPSANHCRAFDGALGIPTGITTASCWDGSVTRIIARTE